MSKNKYLEKVAETYSVKPHSDDKSYYGVKHVHLSKDEFDRYDDAKGVHPLINAVGLGAGAGAGLSLGNSYAKATMMPTIHALHAAGLSRNAITSIGRTKALTNKIVGLGLGIGIANHYLNKIDHNKRLENAGFSVIHGREHE
jgi:hypothetical protein